MKNWEGQTILLFFQERTQGGWIKAFDLLSHSSAALHLEEREN